MWVDTGSTTSLIKNSAACKFDNLREVVPIFLKGISGNSKHNEKIKLEVTRNATLAKQKQIDSYNSNKHRHTLTRILACAST